MNAVPDRPDEGADHLRRLLLMRWFAVAGQLALVAAAGPLLEVALPLAPMLAIIALLAGFNLATRKRLARGGAVADRELFAQLGVDITALTLLLFFSGGAANPLVSLYLPSIAIAAVVLPGRFAWGVVALSVAAYSLLVFWSVPLPMADAERATRLHLAGMWLIFVASAALIAWFVARMAAAIRSRDRELAAAREEALRNERVIALGSLAAGAAHELGTPLATMAILVGELGRNAEAKAELQEDLALLRSQIEHCKGIITGLAARAGQLRAEGGAALGLDRWLEQLIERWRRLRPHAEAKVSLRGTAAPRVVGEATLEQALLNLFNNAADADGGAIEIEAEWDSDRLRLEVRDRGAGFDENVLLAAGRAFVTTRAEGTGIGLFLAHAAVERLGGRISLANRAGGGAVTRVELPLDKLKAEG
ncbi:MAG: HAMP domain-containing histidine kinase [Zoogloeaceae bacterium]|nr:HAMP domain-containing histidine kinase [Zoogloeaceae bacterium]MCK6383627.1 ATP-binding protein [Rhodocyclaceae bacterium]